MKVEAVLFGRRARDVRLEEDVEVWLGDESEDGRDGPGQDSRLFTRQRGDQLAPALELTPCIAAAVGEVVESFSDSLRALRRLDGIAQGHLLKGEEEIGSRLKPHGARSNLMVVPFAQKRTELRLVEP